MNKTSAISALFIGLSIIVSGGCSDVREKNVSVKMELKPKVSVDAYNSVGYQVSPRDMDSQYVRDAIVLKGWKVTTYGAADLKIIVDFKDESILNKQYTLHQPGPGYQNGYLGTYSVKRSVFITAQIKDQSPSTVFYNWERELRQGDFSGPLYPSPQATDYAFGEANAVAFRNKLEADRLIPSVNEWINDNYGKGSSDITFTLLSVDDEKEVSFAKALANTEAMVAKNSAQTTASKDDWQQALALWDLAMTTQNPQHAAAALYNKGIVQFLSGDKEQGVLTVQQAGQKDSSISQSSQSAVYLMKKFM